MSTPSSARSAVSRIDWSRLLTVSLKKDTAASLSAYRKRYDELKRQVETLEASAAVPIDFSHYRSVLKNKEIVDKVEKEHKAFSPVKVDLAKQLEVIGTFEAKALERANQASERIDAEIKDLQKTLNNIEQARPVEDLTVADIVEAKPELIDRVEENMAAGKYSVPGYYEKFGNRNAM
ncbi:MAG: hypothetical protein DHS80DRAFT_21982 [Piptocephalis tieghemiana]|nr:MAG: hypothetical protein DHS80DRAFT_21982 [Piptocephalis tieghemiana]